MHPIVKFKQLFEAITSKEQSLDEIYAILDDIKTWNEDLYVESVNKLSEKVQSFTEAYDYNGEDRPTPDVYGYWILPDGKAIEVDYDHMLYANAHGFGVSTAITEGGWIRVVTYSMDENEFAVQFLKINEKQFRTLIKILNDNDKISGYTRFVDDYRVYTNKAEFVNIIRKLVDKPVTIKTAESDAKYHGIAAVSFQGNQSERRRIEDKVKTAVSKGTTFDKLQKSLPATVKKNPVKLKATKDFYNAKSAKQTPVKESIDYDNLAFEIRNRLTKETGKNGSQYTTLFHGTDEDSFKKIEQTGKIGTDSDSITFFTKSAKEAKEYASMKSKYRGKEAAPILKVTLPAQVIRKGQMGVTGHEYEVDGILTIKDIDGTNIIATHTNKDLVDAYGLERDTQIQERIEGVDSQIWYNPKTNKLISINPMTHMLYAKRHPEKFGLDPKSKGDFVSGPIRNGWVRMGAYGDAAYITSLDELSARKGLNAILKQYPNITHAEMEIGNNYKDLHGDEMTDFVKKGIIKYINLDESLYNSLLNKKETINEAVSTVSALKVRNDLIKLARKHTDSANIVAPSNFESYEEQSDIILKISIYDLDKNKLDNIKSNMVDTLSAEGWLDKEGIYKKNNIRIKFFEIKKVFRSGAYQNRETPHLGIAIKGPKRAIIDHIITPTA